MLILLLNGIMNKAWQKYRFMRVFSCWRMKEVLAVTPWTAGWSFLCLEMSKVRTLWERFLLPLSEVGPGSDFASAVSAFWVRSWRGFRLCRRGFRFLSPKLARIPTLPAQFPLSVSEVGPGYNSISAISPFSVRSWPRFGLCGLSFPFLCPKLAGFQL